MDLSLRIIVSFGGSPYLRLDDVLLLQGRVSSDVSPSEINRTFVLNDYRLLEPGRGVSSPHRASRQGFCARTQRNLVTINVFLFFFLLRPYTFTLFLGLSDFSFDRLSRQTTRNVSTTSPPVGTASLYDYTRRQEVPTPGL